MQDIQEYSKDGRSIRIGYRLIQLQKLNKLINDNQAELLSLIPNQEDPATAEIINILTPLSVLKKEYSKLYHDYKKVILPNRTDLNTWAKSSALIVGHEFEPLASLFVPLVYAISAGTPAVLKFDGSNDLEGLISRLVAKYLDPEMYVYSKTATSDLLTQDFAQIIATRSYFGNVNRAEGVNVVALLDTKQLVDQSLAQLVKWKEAAGGRTLCAPDIVLVNDLLLDKVVRVAQNGLGFKVNVLTDLLAEFPQRNSPGVLNVALCTTEAAILCLQTNKINLFTYLGSEPFGTYLLKFAPQVKTAVVNSIRLTFYDDIDRSRFQTIRSIQRESKLRSKALVSSFKKLSYDATKLPNLPIKYSRNIGFFEQGFFLSLGFVGLTTTSAITYGVYRLIKYVFF